MSPKEKAQELFDKYYQIFEEDEDEHYIGTCKRISKLSALIAVDEIIEEVYNNESSISRYKYWQEVKQFIEEI
jgi:hypothetical protein